MSSIKLVRTSTVPTSLNIFCKGLLRELREDEGFDVVAVSSPGVELEEIAGREGVRTISINMERRISPLNDLISLCRLILVMHREKPYIVHSITPKAGLLSMCAAWICRVPIRLHTFTGLVFPTAKGLQKKILMSTDRLTCAFATHIIPEGEGVKRDLNNFKITGKPLKVLGHGNLRGIDVDYYDPHLPRIRTEAAKIRQEGVFTFIFVGRLVGDKGINELVEAFDLINRECKNVRLLLIGTNEQELDPLNADTLKIIKENPNIETKGWLDDVRPWLAASDVFVFPSYREGFPNVVIEAGAMGLPSIVTDINGSREIIINGQNGLIIPPRDTASLYSAMKQMIDNDHLRRAMALNSRGLIVSRYEQSFVRKCLKDYYREIMSA